MPGSHASVQKLKKMFDTGKDHNLLVMDAIDPNDIATLLKLYLRECKSLDWATFPVPQCRFILRSL